MTNITAVAKQHPLAINEVYPVENKTDMLELKAQQGDMAILSSTRKTYVLTGDSPTTLTDWKMVNPSGLV
jgi:hypothetical protein